MTHLYREDRPACRQTGRSEPIRLFLSTRNDDAENLHISRNGTAWLALVRPSPDVELFGFRY